VPVTTADGTFRSMRIRNFRLFIGGQLISQGGTWMQIIALAWVVLHLSGDNGFDMGLSIALQFVPTLLFGVWGGAIADRFDKRRVLVWTQVAMALVALVLAVVDLTGVIELWMVYALVFLLGIALAVDNPTRQAFVAELVEAPDLPNAIGVSSASFQLARVLGPAVAGVMIVSAGTGACFVINAVSFLFVIGSLLMMRSSELHPSVPIGREKGQLREGLEYCWHTAELRWILLLMLVVGTFAINFAVVLPLIAKITFHENATAYSWMSIAMGAGAVFGALFVAKRSDTRGTLLCGIGMVFGVSILVAALAPTLALFVALLVVVGGGQIGFLAVSNSALQLISDPTMRGRVMAVYMITVLGTTPLGGPLVGWISGQFGPRWGFAVGGIATVVGVLCFGGAFLRARKVSQGRLVEEPEPLAFGVDGEAIPASVG
jgi:MFS family permease